MNAILRSKIVVACCLEQAAEGMTLAQTFEFFDELKKLRTVDLRVTKSIGVKDQYKANVAEAFIGIGATGSSTELYQKAFHVIGKDNHRSFDEGELVFISINGKRPGRVGIGAILPHLRALVLGNGIAITDNQTNAERAYNIGEREVARFLSDSGYQRFNFQNFGIWLPPKLLGEAND